MGNSRTRTATAPRRSAGHSFKETATQGVQTGGSTEAMHSAGGVTIDLDGQPITLDYGLNSLPEINRTMSTRRTFIAAGNQLLAEEILRTIHPKATT